MTAVRVDDEGSRIPDTDRDVIFEPAYTANQENTGLGLPIGQHIVDAHGWDHTPIERADGGMRFEIYATPSHP